MRLVANSIPFYDRDWYYLFHIIDSCIDYYSDNALGRKEYSSEYPLGREDYSPNQPHIWEVRKGTSVPQSLRLMQDRLGDSTYVLGPSEPMTLGCKELPK